MPKKSGKLFLEDPRPGPNIVMPRRVEDIPEALWRVCAYEPRGSYDIFSILASHGVDINMNTEKGEKIENICILIISYNYEF